MRRIRVLVADDNQELRKHLTMLLQPEFEVVGAVADGMSLIDAAIELHPDIIVSDISMPKLSGPQAMRELNAQGFEIPFVFVSCDELRIEQSRMAFVSKMDMGDKLVPAVHRAFLTKARPGCS